MRGSSKIYQVNRRFFSIDEAECEAPLNSLVFFVGSFQFMRLNVRFLPIKQVNVRLLPIYMVECNVPLNIPSY